MNIDNLNTTTILLVNFFFVKNLRNLVLIAFVTKLPWNLNDIFFVGQIALNLFIGAAIVSV